MSPTKRLDAEWLETDGLGGFASGTVGTTRTRRYHALLLAARRPPTDRVVLVNGFEAWVETGEGSFALSHHRYLPGVSHPDGHERLEAFESDPWPRWVFRVGSATVIQELFVTKGSPMTVISWRLEGAVGDAALRVRPLLSGRDYHALHRENGAFRFDTTTDGQCVTWQPYPDQPAVVAASNGAYRHAPDWYRSFLYEEERARGLDHEEDLASPGELSFDLGRAEATLVLTTADAWRPHAGSDVAELCAELASSERERRARMPSALVRAADSYLVRRGRGQTVVAGYPWFTDWGRDTFIALRGLCLATGRLEEARAILLEWADAVSEGMLPNRFPDGGESPEFNSVDASLWYVVAVHDYERRAGAAEPRLREAVAAILGGYSAGTRHGIRADADGLLAAGAAGVQLTWMDAKVGDWVVTPRIGKPVEVQALWLNALRIGAGHDTRWRLLYERAAAVFAKRFWNGRHLYDVVDVDHRPGVVDGSFRPNQILAVGGLPFPVLNGERAQALVAAVEAHLWTPLGLRSLAAGEPAYARRYEGGVAERDGAYHQGTVWPWLAGPFIEAWVRVRGGTDQAKRQARERFLDPLRAHLDEAGLGHVSEIADAQSPHTPRGCPFQAWSVGELLRIDLEVLA